MTRVDEFDSFYRSTSADVLAVTYAVVADRTVARDAVVDAYRRAWRDWSKIRDGNALSYVRAEAWKLTALERGTHPLRRRHEEDADTDLLDALATLPVDDRRLIVLMTLGRIDLDLAAREVGVDDEEAIESVTAAIDRLESSTGQNIVDLEQRLGGLAAIATSLPLPTGEQIRQRAVAGQRRNTVALVGAAIIALVLGGLVATEGDVLARSSILPTRQQLGAESPDLVLDARQIDTGDLLSRGQVARLDPTATWKVTDTDTNGAVTKPYATCPPTRYATIDPLKVFLRTYEASGDTNERVAQAIEVAPSEAAAQQAYSTLVSWYADCSHPRTQLTETYRIERPFGDFLIMRLVSNRSPQRTFTVGISQSGTVTSTVVHEIDGLTAPSITDFAATLNASVQRVCADSGGACSNDVTILASGPPPTSEAPQFLGVVDLPPIATVDNVWSGVAPEAGGANPAATPCDRVEFAGGNVTSVGSRIFVIPEAPELPAGFGVVETVGRFGSVEEASAFVQDVRNRIAACPDNTLSAEVAETGALASTDGAITGTTWSLSFEVDQTAARTVRTAIIQRGNAVAQVLFSPSGQADMTPEQFNALALRAGERLAYLG